MSKTRTETRADLEVMAECAARLHQTVDRLLEDEGFADPEAVNLGGPETGELSAAVSRLLEVLHDRHHRAERLATVLEESVDFIAVTDAKGIIQWANRAAREALGVPLPSERAGSLTEFQPEWAAIRLRDDGLPAALETGSWLGETAFITPDGGIIPTSHLLIPHRSSQGDLEFITTVARDVRPQKRTEARYRALVDAIPDLLFRIDVDGTYLDVKADDESLLLVPPDRLIGTNLRDAPLPRTIVQQTLELLRLAVETGRIQVFEYELSVGGRMAHFECRIVRSDARECVCIVRDVTARVRADALATETLFRLESLANKDPLTSVLNLRAFKEHLRLAIDLARQRGERAAVLFLDLDGFKPVNDSHGHEAGDRVLQELAERLVVSLRASDRVGRIGGDEFAVVIGGFQDDPQVDTVARKLIESVSRPITVGPEVIEVGVSIGVARFPTDAHEPDELIRRADEAMYRAKQAGGNTVVFS